MNEGRRAWARCIAALFACIGVSAFAGTTQAVTGTFIMARADLQNVARWSAHFTCIGFPTCNGAYSAVVQDPGCSNSYAMDDIAITITGLDLSVPGNISAQLRAAQNWTSTPSAPGSSTCNYTLGTDAAPPLPFNASWDGARGTMDYPLTGGTGILYHVAGVFTAAVGASPVFPMTGTGSVPGRLVFNANTPPYVSFSAQIQPRTQDVGRRQSVYVFAHAPANRVLGAAATAKRDDGGHVSAGNEDAAAIVCVLAQVNADGQLVAVSASTMQAYLTTVLTSQSQAVQVLNNVEVPSVAGATMYVGYGDSAQAMLSSGLFQAAVSVPGLVQCTASLSSAPAPQAPNALSGLWWNAAESGWGIDFTQRRNIIFAAWYTYDASGNPKWYVASNCVTPSSGATSGTCTGNLYEVNGPVFFGATFNPSLVHVNPAGSLLVNFQNVNNASMMYTVGTQTRTVAITRQIFPAGATPAVDYTDLWWNSPANSEPGWGAAISHQAGTIFLAWYVYDASGKPMWYVASNCVVSGSSCSGALYRTTGPPLGPTFDPTKVKAFQVGNVIVSFVDANNAILSYTVDGASATKIITRQTF